MERECALRMAVERQLADALERLRGAEQRLPQEPPADVIPLPFGDRTPISEEDYLEAPKPTLPSKRPSNERRRADFF